MARKTQSYFSNSEFQTKMLKIFVGISALQGVLFAIVGFGLIQNVQNMAVHSGIPETHVFHQNLRMEQTYVYVIVLAGVLLSSMIFIWLGLKQSHEAVGAIYRMKKDIDKMTTTKSLFQVKLRKNDFFKDFEKSFNDMVVAVAPHLDFEQDLDEFTPTPVPDKGKNKGMR